MPKGAPPTGSLGFGLEIALARRRVNPFLKYAITLTLSAAIPLSEESVEVKFKVNIILSIFTVYRHVIL